MLVLKKTAEKEKARRAIDARDIIIVLRNPIYESAAKALRKLSEMRFGTDREEQR